MIRNLDAIKRKSALLQNQRQAEDSLMMADFNARIKAIQGCQQDAIDAIDTIREVVSSFGLRQMFYDWDSKQSLHYNSHDSAFRCGDYERGKVSYAPENNVIYFSWSAHGCCETYRSHNIDAYRVRTWIKSDNREYMKNLDLLASNLKIYLDAFFAWAENL